MAKRALIVTLRERYRSSSKKDKSRILDEFIAITGHHRKHMHQVARPGLRGRRGSASGTRPADLR